MTATTGTSESRSAAADLDAAARRVDTAMERVDLLDPSAKKVAHDLKAALEEFHREGLIRIVKALKGDPRGKELLFELVDDPVVYGLFVMHGIVRADPATLAQRALEEVRPYLESHGGGVELVDVELPVARIRLSGTCSGCSQSSATLREVVERALVSQVQGLHEVVVVPSEPAPALVPLASVGLRPGAAPAGPPTQATGWTRGPAVDDLPDGKVTLWHPEGVAPDDQGVVLVRLGDRISAFRDACAHLGFSLEKGIIDTEGGILICPWHGMKYQALTGECISAVDKRLEAYPARVDGGVLWLRLPG